MVKKLIFLIIVSFILNNCTTNKTIKEHRYFVSIAKQIVSPGLGWK